MPEMPALEWLDHFAVGLRFVLESVSLVCVALGFAATLRLGLRQTLRQSLLLNHGRQSQGRRFNSLRLTFGSWLSMALEFQLAADIVATTTAPSNQNLIQLGVIAVIRTFLNVFLGREVELELKFEESQRQQTEPSAPTDTTPSF
ncbi:DUF1622 domain-containing protein [Synechococcus sp. BA-132 BA5]|uniref:DUF1622 domain-containing protein n=1 Tax=Synechococcus sp. BA-132 BA5 TaxID=3110252 RepID=UPI002B21DB64|nr:DUF1622 domain-containing protein [Synechococcus sp. BA-132 BA5]MEA5414183.1 DUF1622 domain-containing protein [Synechococcus sp. BA-132 BA5]